MQIFFFFFFFFFFSRLHVFKQEGKDGPVLLTLLQDKFESNGLSVQEKKLNIDFQDDSYLGFLIIMILATSDLQVTSILQMKFQVNCPFGSGEKFKIDFQQGSYGNQLRFPIRIIWLFFINKSPRYLLSSFESMGLSVQEKTAKIDFQDGNCSGQFIFPIVTILAIFDL